MPCVERQSTVGGCCVLPAVGEFGLAVSWFLSRTTVSAPVAQLCAWALRRPTPPCSCSRTRGHRGGDRRQRPALLADPRAARPKGRKRGARGPQLGPPVGCRAAWADQPPELRQPGEAARRLAAGSRRSEGLSQRLGRARCARCGRERVALQRGAERADLPDAVVGIVGKIGRHASRAGPGWGSCCRGMLIALVGPFEPSRGRFCSSSERCAGLPRRGSCPQVWLGSTCPAHEGVPRARPVGGMAQRARHRARGWCGEWPSGSAASRESAPRFTICLPRLSGARGAAGVIVSGSARGLGCRLHLIGEVGGDVSEDLGAALGCGVRAAGGLERGSAALAECRGEPGCRLGMAPSVDSLLRAWPSRRVRCSAYSHPGTTSPARLLQPLRAPAPGPGVGRDRHFEGGHITTCATRDSSPRYSTRRSCGRWRGTWRSVMCATRPRAGAPGRTRSRSGATTAASWPSPTTAT